jgi:hypothetical protein
MQQKNQKFVENGKKKVQPFQIFKLHLCHFRTWIRSIPEDPAGNICSQRKAYSFVKWDVNLKRERKLPNRNNVLILSLIRMF